MKFTLEKHKFLKCSQKKYQKIAIFFERIHKLWEPKPCPTQIHFSFFMDPIQMDFFRITYFHLYPLGWV